MVFKVVVTTDENHSLASTPGRRSLLSISGQPICVPGRNTWLCRTAGHAVIVRVAFPFFLQLATLAVVSCETREDRIREETEVHARVAIEYRAREVKIVEILRKPCEYQPWTLREVLDLTVEWRYLCWSRLDLSLLPAFCEDQRANPNSPNPLARICRD